MEVFICDISSVSPKDLENAKLFLSVSEKKRLESMVSVKRQREFITGHYLLRRLLSKKYKKPIEQIEVISLQSGALFLPDTTLGYVNLSHSFDTVAIALSDSPVGLDIEKMRPKNNFNEILAQIDSVKAAAILMKKGYSLQESFFKLWTKREAVYKINSIYSIPNEDDLYLSYHQHDDFMLCVAITTEQKIEWNKIEFEKC